MNLPQLLALSGLLATAGCSPSAEARPAPPPAASSPSAASPKPAAAAGKPVLTFGKLVQDFGRVSDTATVTTEFGFTNTGGGTLVIEEVKASCGCTTTTLARTEFGPGDGEAIAVEWDMIGAGPQTKTITVRSNATPPILQLKITAFSVPFVSRNPYMAQFGQARRDVDHRQVIQLECQDPNFTITNVETTQDSLQARILSPPKDGKAQIEVFLLPTVKWGQYFAKVLIDVSGQLEGEPIEHRVEVSAAAFAYDGVVLQPTYFTVGHVHPKEAFEFEIVVSSPTQEPFEVLSAEVVTATIDDIRVEVRAQADGTTRLVLIGDPEDYLGPLQGQVRFTTNLPSDPDRTVNIVGLVRH